jgi:hypothetical protein
MREHEQVETGKQEQDEREQRQEAYPDGLFVPEPGHDVDDDSHRKGHGQPAVDLPNPIAQIHGTSLDGEPKCDAADFQSVRANT